MSTGENQIVVYQPNETLRLELCAEIIPRLLASIRKAALERREYGKSPKSRGCHQVRRDSNKADEEIQYE